MSRSPTASGRVWRCALATLLAAASIGWIGEARSSAAAPAELVSVSPTGGAPLGSSDSLPSVSGDGNIVVFTAVPIFGVVFVGNVQVVVRNRSAGTTTVVPSPAFVDRTTRGVVSRDGCHLAFWGYFTGFFFFPAQWEIFSWDRCTAGSSPVYISGAGGLLTSMADVVGPLAISADGSHVGYVAVSAAGGSIAARINTTPTLTEDQLHDGFFNGNSIDISDDGAFLALGGQSTVNDLTRNVVDGWAPPCVPVGEFSYNCNSQLISVGSTGQNASEVNYKPSTSADGRYVAFTSNIPDYVGAAGLTANQVYVRDRVTNATRLVSTTPSTLMPGSVDDPEISPDGSQIALVQAAPPTANAKPVREVFVARSTSGYFDAAAFDLVSYGVSGAPTSQDSGLPSMSSNGRYVAFASGANNELSGVTLPAGLEVWMRTRPIALDITPSIDFGTVDLGGQSAPKDAVITNTSNVAINIASVSPPTAPFTITTNGCAGVLPPSATCTVTLVFSPTAAGGASSSFNVSGDGLSVSASLSGVGRAPNVPTPGSLKIKPTSANFGSAPAGTSLPAKKFVVSNPGQTAVPLAGVALGGTDADQFSIVSNGCTGALAGGATCTIQVSATVTREGSLTATLGVLGSGGQSAQATLRLGGEFTPTLKMNPGVVSVGKITAALGSGFPPDIDVDLAFEGEAPFGTVHTDSGGAFRFNFLLLTGVRIGGRQVIAVDQPQFTGVRAPLLIDLPKYRPSGFSSPQLTSGIRSLVNRGG